MNKQRKGRLVDSAGPGKEKRDNPGLPRLRSHPFSKKRRSELITHNANCERPSITGGIAGNRELVAIDEIESPCRQGILLFCRPDKQDAVSKGPPVVFGDAGIPKGLKFSDGRHSPASFEFVNPCLCVIPGHVFVRAYLPVKIVVLKTLFASARDKQ